MRTKFFHSNHHYGQRNEYGRDKFYDVFMTAFRKNIKLIKYQHASSTIVPDKRDFELGKKACHGSIFSKITAGFAFFGNILTGESNPGEAYTRRQEHAIRVYDERKKPGIKWVAEQFQTIDRQSLEAISKSIANEIIPSLENLIYNLSNDECTKLANCMVIKMINYPMSGEENPLYSLEDNLRIGLFKEFEPIDFSARRLLEEKVHLHPHDHHFRHSIKCLLEREKLNWGMVNGKVKIYNGGKEYYPQSYPDNNIHCKF